MTGYPDTNRRPEDELDPTIYMTHPTGVVFHVLKDGEDPLFITNSSCRYSVWRLGINRGSTIMVHTERVCCENTFDGKNIEVPIQKLFDEYVESIREQFLPQDPRHHVVIAEPRACSEDGGMNCATIGFFSVPRQVHVRLYGRTVEIPTVTHVGKHSEDVALTDLDVEEVLSDAPTPAEVDAVVGPTLIDSEIEKERKTLRNEILGFAVDLLKAGSGHYDGEAAQTLRNLVTSRLDEVIVDRPDRLDRRSQRQWQAVFLTKALVKLTGLGKFVLPMDKHEYFGQRCIEKIGQMKAARGIPLQNRPKVNIVRVGEDPVVAPVQSLVGQKRHHDPLPNKNKADLRAEAEKARVRIREKLRVSKEVSDADVDRLVSIVGSDFDFNVFYDYTTPAAETEYEKKGGKVEDIWHSDPDASSEEAPEMPVERPDGL